MGFMNNLAASVLSIAANSSDPEIQQSAESLNNLRVATIGYTDNEKQQIAAAEDATRIEEQQAEEARQKAEAEKQRAEQERLTYSQPTYKQSHFIKPKEWRDRGEGLSAIRNKDGTYNYGYKANSLLTFVMNCKDTNQFSPVSFGKETYNAEFSQCDGLYKVYTAFDNGVIHTKISNLLIGEYVFHTPLP
ncbi:MAG: cell envelope integrity protein TolA [Moraxellaceae bacterium]|nr:cell envelope integrity protein TolA [Moraxellaceae bacterium]